MAALDNAVVAIAGTSRDAGRAAAQSADLRVATGKRAS